MHEVPKDFWRLDEGAEIVDIAQGKKHIAVVSSNGKLYAAGIQLWNHFEGCRFNKETHGDFPFELKLLPGYSA